jgi:hypothetical protein
MKYFFITFLLIVSITFKINAQNEPQIPDSTLKQIAKDMCECFNKRDNNGKIIENSQTSEESLNMCFGLVVLKYSSIMPKSDDDVTATGEKLGRLVAPYLMSDCPKFIQYIMLKNTDKEEIKVEEKSKYIIYEGILQKIETKNYTFLVVTNDAKELNKFIWLGKFENDTQIIDNFRSWRGKRVKIEVENTTPLYNPKTKKYEVFKEIKSIQEVK